MFLKSQWPEKSCQIKCFRAAKHKRLGWVPSWRCPPHLEGQEGRVWGRAGVCGK